MPVSNMAVPTKTRDANQASAILRPDGAENCRQNQMKPRNTKLRWLK